MAIPKYADPRSHVHFHRYYVGNKDGDNGTDYRTSWDTQSDPRPTTTFRIGPSAQFCIYCGNNALFIQDGRFEVTGHACCCKGAMDELEWADRYRDLMERHRQEIAELKRDLPATKADVINWRLNCMTEGVSHEISDRINLGTSMDRFDPLEISVNSPVRDLME